jgi:hypothetical protein
MTPVTRVTASNHHTTRQRGDSSLPVGNTSGRKATTRANQTLKSQPETQATATYPGEPAITYVSPPTIALAVSATASSSHPTAFSG